MIRPRQPLLSLDRISSCAPARLLPEACSRGLQAAVMPCRRTSSKPRTAPFLTVNSGPWAEVPPARQERRSSLQRGLASEAGRSAAGPRGLGAFPRCPAAPVCRRRLRETRVCRLRRRRVRRPGPSRQSGLSGQSTASKDLPSAWPRRTAGSSPLLSGFSAVRVKEPSMCHKVYQIL
jgi:hypothetical protein